MSIEYTAVAAIGNQFKSAWDARSWFDQNYKGVLSAQERQELDEIQEFIENSERDDFPQWDFQKHITATSPVLGYPLRGGPLADFQARLAEATRNWEKYFVEPLAVITEGKLR